MKIFIEITCFLLLVFLFSRECVFGAIAPMQPRITETNSALVYLAHYGYLEASVSNPKSGALISENAVTNSLLAFQAFAGIAATGKLDNATLTMMSMKRCGNRDLVGHGANARKKRYALQGSRWRTRDLVYHISKYPLDLLETEVDRDILKAFQIWSEVTDLKFRKAIDEKEKKHIEIRFENAEHGDGDPFDGPGGTLAHAYFPIYGGDAHFDAGETWTVEKFRGTNLFQVAVHEFGHSLGLSHSDVQSALMAPFYRGYQPTFKLDKDDITAIQALYGKKNERTPSSTTPKSTDSDSGKTDSDNPLLCKDPKGKIDALVAMKAAGEKESVYLFKGENYWKLTDDGVAKGYPRDISADFEGLPGNLDAAFPWTKGRVYFFKGSKYYRFTDLKMDANYPKNISTGFRGIPNDVQAAFVWGGNGKIYFFKGKQYWRFDPTQTPNVKDYPKKLANWEGIPSNIETALQYTNGFTYFFKNGQYWRFNDRGFKVDSADPPFPRQVGYWWLGCKKSNQLNQDSGIQGDGRSVTHVVGADDVTDSADAVRKFFRKIFGG